MKVALRRDIKKMALQPVSNKTNVTEKSFFGENGSMGIKKELRLQFL